jgi:hypothetical protein
MTYRGFVRPSTTMFVLTDEESQGCFLKLFRSRLDRASLNIEKIVETTCYRGRTQRSDAVPQESRGTPGVTYILVN